MARNRKRSEPSAPDHGALIDALGGTPVVADLIRKTQARGEKPISDEAISNMKRRGVAWRYRHLLAQEAARKGVSLPKNFLPAA